MNFENKFYFSFLTLNLTKRWTCNKFEVENLLSKKANKNICE